jgi:two-component system, OmpR family, sensor kinase
VEVRDRGPGLALGTESSVFERFWRADSGPERSRNGPGLGLAIVREIVDSHHGTALAANHPGGGAVFTVRLPLAPPAPGAESGRRAALEIGVPVA